MHWRWCWALAVFVSASAFAQAPSDRFSAGGYYRIMARPDFDGGNGRLGFWNLYGRLLNEGPYAALEMKLDVLQSAANSGDTWASVHARVEGGSVGNADPSNGNLSQFRLSQLYARAGNVLFDRVEWQLGTLQYYFGDLGLYDLRPAMLFDDTIGLSARYRTERFDVLVGLGDSGFALRGAQYAPLFTSGAAVRVRLGRHLELGGGGQFAIEPLVEGNRNSSYVTPGIAYEDFVRREVVQHFLDEHPGQENLFPKPQPAGTASISYRVVGYLGFGSLGPLKWNNLFFSFKRLHPDNRYVETVAGRDYTLYIADLTRERYQLQLGNEMQLTLWPERLDLAWAALYGNDSNLANTIAAGDDNRTYLSTVLRLQLYLSKSFHLLAEGSLAQERSKNGNLFRQHYDSIFQSAGGAPDTRGLEWGDSAVRNTWQLKAGVVLNPTGLGIYARPSFRILYGVQYSSQQTAFGSGFTESLDQFNQFPGTERHWHHLISLESEGWF